VKNRLRLAGFTFALLLSASLNGAKENAIVSRTATVDGVKLSYLTAGHGPTVILLHGYTQTSRMWKPIIPLLAKKFIVIAPDLPGIGDSEKFLRLGST
jgi:pimeloyl-ACP methyl ester carboxylesterase